MEQTKLGMPKDKKDIKVLIKLDKNDLQALESGMAAVGETMRSSYIRRLIHEHKGGRKNGR